MCLREPFCRRALSGRRRPIWPVAFFPVLRRCRSREGGERPSHIRVRVLRIRRATTPLELEATAARAGSIAAHSTRIPACCIKRTHIRHSPMGLCQQNAGNARCLWLQTASRSWSSCEAGFHLDYLLIEATAAISLVRRLTFRLGALARIERNTNASSTAPLPSGLGIKLPESEACVRLCRSAPRSSSSSYPF